MKDEARSLGHSATLHPSSFRLPPSSHGDAGDAQADAVERGARGEIEGLPVVLAPADVGGLLRDADAAEQLGEGAEDPDAAGAGAVDVPRAVELHAVGTAAAVAR